MKKIALLLVGVLVGTTTYAGVGAKAPKGASDMIVLKQNDYSFKLIYKSEEKADVKVQILNSKNAVVFAEVIRNSDGFARPYDFGNLAIGDYTIRVDNGRNGFSKTVHNGSGLIEKAAQIIHLKDGRYMLTVAGHGQNKLSINVFDEQGSIVRTDSRVVDGNFAQLYDLRNLKGAFTFEVKDEQGSSRILQK